MNKQRPEKTSQTGANTECPKEGYIGNHYWEYPVWVGGDGNGSGWWEGNKMRCKLCGMVTEPSV